MGEDVMLDWSWWFSYLPSLGVATFLPGVVVCKHFLMQSHFEYQQWFLSVFPAGLKVNA